MRNEPFSRALTNLLEENRSSIPLRWTIHVVAISFFHLRVQSPLRLFQPAQIDNAFQRLPRHLPHLTRKPWTCPSERLKLAPIFPCYFIFPFVVLISE